MLDQQWDILAALAQRWQHERKNIDPMKQILPKFLLAYARFEIAMGCNDHSHVDRNRLIASDAFDFSLFQHAQ